MLNGSGINGTEASTRCLAVGDVNIKNRYMHSRRTPQSHLSYNRISPDNISAYDICISA